MSYWCYSRYQLNTFTDFTYFTHLLYIGVTLDIDVILYFSDLNMPLFISYSYSIFRGSFRINLAVFVSGWWTRRAGWGWGGSSPSPTRVSPCAPLSVPSCLSGRGHVSVSGPDNPQRLHQFISLKKTLQNGFFSQCLSYLYVRRMLTFGLIMHLS